MRGANPAAIRAAPGPRTSRAATAASAAKTCADGIRLGDYDIGIAVGLDKHPKGAFTKDPALVGMPRWYAENGQYLTTQFFGMKANRYLHEHGISHRTLAKVAAKNYRNGVLNPNAFRRTPIGEDDILASQLVNYPLTQYMFCSPDEGAAAVIMCRGDIAHKFTDKPVYVRASEIRTRTFGAYEVHATSAPLEEDPSPTVFAAKAAYEAAGIGLEDVDIAQLYDGFSFNCLSWIEALGFCGIGEAKDFLDGGAAIARDGAIPLNTHGGQLSFGQSGSAGAKRCKRRPRNTPSMLKASGRQWPLPVNSPSSACTLSWRSVSASASMSSSASPSCQGRRLAAQSPTKALSARSRKR